MLFYVGFILFGKLNFDSFVKRLKYVRFKAVLNNES